MRKNIILGLGILLLAAGCSNQTTGSQHQVQTTGQTQNQQASSTTGQTYSMDQVAAAKNAQKCWTAIGGKVYDLTPFINRHPGGPAKILSLCGKDGTADFTKQHGSTKKAQDTLKALEIGMLK